MVLDDGVTGRLGPQRYLMTTTSSGATVVGEWVERWLRELIRRLTDVDVSADAFGYLRVRLGHVAGVADCVVWRIGFTGELSDAAAAMLAKLCPLELSEPAVPDGAACRSLLAGIAVQVVRDDREDRRCFLLLCDRSYGQYLWDALLDAGAEFDLHV